jgi:predicted deacylase
MKPEPRPGTKSTGLWIPGESGLPALPVHCAMGVQSGPHLLITGGVHGDEYEGPATAESFFAQLDPTRLTGTVTLLPVVNVSAWQARQRRTPIDDADLNRSFPGDLQGKPTARLAAAVFETFVRPAHAVIDLHSGGIAMKHLPMVGVPGTDSRAQQLLDAFDRRFHSWRMPDVPGVFSNEAQKLGKIAVGVEWGGGGSLDPIGVAALTDALARSLQALGMGDGGFKPPALNDSSSRPILAGNYQGSPGQGIWHPGVLLGDTVVQGDPLGRLHDPLTGKVTVVCAERPGVIAALPHGAWLMPNAPLAYIG